MLTESIIKFNKDSISRLPVDPGVYRFYDSEMNLLYVGKAKNIKSRVKSYIMNADNINERIKYMIRLINFIELNIVDNETDALLLENNFIKTLKPKFNILLRDDKSYPWIALSVSKFPRIFVYRGNKKKSLKLFGPYPNAKSVKENIRLFQNIFKIRTCTDSIFKSRIRPCLLYQIKKCSGPCVKKISQSNYEIVLATDFDGNYAISASEGDVLTYSYVGYESQEVRIRANFSIDIQLEPNTALDEVVVMGYQSKKRSEITAAVSTINTQELTNLNTSTSISNMLQGKAAGVQVVATNGKPGSGAYVRIRGIGSITAGSAPLFIIDGVQAPNTANLNPFDIESVSVLKDAASSAIYGSRAANGVIVITTKRGKKNKRASIEFTSRYGFASQTDELGFRVMNSAEKLLYERELGILGFGPAQAQPGFTSSLEEYNRLAAVNFDWKDALLRDGEVVTNSLSVSGGDENFQYYLSLSEEKNEGIIDQVTGFQRQSARLNVDYQAKDWLKVGVNVSVADTRSDEPRDRYNLQSPIYAAYTSNPYETEYVTDENGDFVLDENGDKQYNFVGFGWSITEALENNPEFEGRTTLLANLNLVADLSDNLTNTTNFGINNQKFRREYYYKPGSRLDSFVGDANAPGGKTDNGSYFTDYNVSNVLNYTNSFDNHNLSVSGLFEFNKITFCRLMCPIRQEIVTVSSSSTADSAAYCSHPGRCQDASVWR